VATHDIHVPRVPHERFRGKSQTGVRGESILSFDWTVGQIVAALEKLNLTDNTLIIITSDNGGSLETNGPDHINSGTVETNNGHPYNGVLRGGKYSPFEGGTRVPFIVRWSGRVPVGASDALICQIDMLATFAAITGQPLADDDAPDSENMLPVLLGGEQGREFLVQSGRAFRMGHWKLLPPNTVNQQGNRSWLFHLGNDLSERHNVADEYPEIVTKMAAELQRIRNTPRTRP